MKKSPRIVNDRLFIEHEESGMRLEVAGGAGDHGHAVWLHLTSRPVVLSFELDYQDQEAIIAYLEGRPLDADTDTTEE